MNQTKEHFKVLKANNFLESTKVDENCYSKSSVLHKYNLIQDNQLNKLLTNTEKPVTSNQSFDNHGDNSHIMDSGLHLNQAEEQRMIDQINTLNEKVDNNNDMINTLKHTLDNFSFQINSVHEYCTRSIKIVHDNQSLQDYLSSDNPHLSSDGDSIMTD